MLTHKKIITLKHKTLEEVEQQLKQLLLQYSTDGWIYKDIYLLIEIIP